MAFAPVRSVVKYLILYIDQMTMNVTFFPHDS